MLAEMPFGPCSVKPHLGRIGEVSRGFWLVGDWSIGPGPLYRPRSDYNWFSFIFIYFLHDGLGLARQCCVCTAARGCYQGHVSTAHFSSGFPSAAMEFGVLRRLKYLLLASSCACVWTDCLLGSIRTSARRDRKLYNGPVTWNTNLSSGETTKTSEQIRASRPKVEAKRARNS